MIGCTFGFNRLYIIKVTTVFLDTSFNRLGIINVEKKLTSDGRDYLIDLSTDNQVYDLLGQLVTALGI